MITNSEIADQLDLAAKLLELNGGDERRFKTFANAVYVIERLEGNLYEMSDDQILAIQGIGKTLLQVIREIMDTGTFQELEDLKDQTPAGVIDLFKVKGLGVKKIKQLWNELGIDSTEKLKAAAQKGEIAALKGFGAKTQESILQSLAFLASQVGKLRINKAIDLSEEIKELLSEAFSRVEVVGQIRQFDEVITKLSFLVPMPANHNITVNNPLFVKDWALSSPYKWVGYFDGNETPIEIYAASETQPVNQRIILNAHRGHLSHQNNGKSFYELLCSGPFSSETEAYETFGSKLILPEMRNGFTEFEQIKTLDNADLIEWESLKGVLHNHSTYSDGKHTLRQMAEYCKSLGFAYFGIADHSQTASYAQGLTPQRVAQQHAEIDALNEELAPFRILKGIESDILLDGSLDFSEDVLATFDYIVASVHQTLNMDIVKATDRLLKAIENPYTTILGHPTGRLLLAREGYPIDYQVIIDACAERNVVIEINASPYRLDLDWRWIPYCLEKGVKLSINPDAHSMNGFYDMHYGIGVARKGGLTRQMTFNAQPLSEILEQLNAKKK